MPISSVFFSEIALQVQAVSGWRTNFEGGRDRYCCVYWNRICLVFETHQFLPFEFLLLQNTKPCNPRYVYFHQARYSQIWISLIMIKSPVQNFAVHQSFCRILRAMWGTSSKEERTDIIYWFSGLGYRKFDTSLKKNWTNCLPNLKYLLVVCYND